MPIEKRKSHSTRYRASLAQNIAKNGFVVMPCSYVTKPAFVEVVLTMALAYRFLPEQRRIKDAKRRAELELDKSQRRLEEA
ncbi:hypothetical protein MYCTH_59085 [Thermothelomyces thermophilus ATCC 42464]|uniref:Uncharacterized protein n=1 Tax=Thermothelomyces thermophilus (strain ATCC 42464 / BCRC 31852 / DSM 1799) TaxID=573729 RepID=G2Q070_THET4|nr:uncharacterized protein MYCTH_59085 [Thermothelomyces thermophilus ATCC 42464]AEO55744.1 hypothetical protein MYCTH_59085 [Thermothelomyces thermophilus ATCC 42464]